MEFKRMEESYEVSYPTYKEWDSSIWRLLMNGKKISIGIIYLYLIINQSIAAPALPDAMGFIATPVPSTEEKIKEFIMNIITSDVTIFIVACLGTLLLVLIITMFMKRREKRRGREMTKK